MIERVELTETLRSRVLRGLHGGALHPGDRLPSARDVGAEFSVDYRIALEAYRHLADEDLVELRPRGGIYVATVRNRNQVPLPAASWLTELIAQGVAREVPATDLHEWIRRAVGTLRLRAVVVQESQDQIDGLCRELADDYGFEAVGLLPDGFAPGAPQALHAEATAAVRATDLLVTTPGLESLVAPAAAAAEKRLIVADVRPDLVGGEWRLMLRRSVYVIVRDPRFIATLTRFFEGTPGAENIRVLVLGSDDLEAIPDDAPVYVTRSARAALAGTRVRGRILPAARVFSSQASREIVRFIVDANLDALAMRKVW